MTCERCGHELLVGQWPFCRGNPDDHGYPSLVVQDDTIDFWQEHFGPTPEHFSSKQAMARRAKELGLLPFVRHMPGRESDKSDKTQRFV